MKKVAVGLVVALLMFTGCESEDAPNVDVMVVKDRQGRFWLLEHNLGDNYYVRPVDSALWTWHE